MAYTPPSNDNVNVELASGGAYSPPSNDAINVELASSGLGGDVSFVTSAGAVSIVAYAPAGFSITHSVPAVSVAADAFAPTTSTTRHTDAPVATVQIDAFAPSTLSTKTTAVPLAEIHAVGYPVTWFNGVNLLVDDTAQVNLAGFAPTTHAQSTTAPPAASLVATPQPPTQRLTYNVPAASMEVSAFAPTYRIAVRAGVTSIYHAPYHEMDVTAEMHVAVFDPTHVIRVHAGAPMGYDATYVMGAAVTGQYTNSILMSVESSYSTQEVLFAAFAGEYDLANRDAVYAALEGKYRNMVHASAEGTYSHLGKVSAALLVPYHLPASLQAAVDGLYGISDRTTIRAAIKSVWSTEGSYVANLSVAPTITVAGDTIPIADCDISCDEGSFVWTGNFQIASLADYSKFRKDQPFTVTLYGDAYHFIVDSKDLNRDAPAGYQAKVVGVSPIMQYAEPRSQSADYFWTAATTAATVAESLIPGIDWQLIDFDIPAHRLGATSTTPVEVVKLLAEAIGGVLESGIDGTIYVRQRFPVSVPDYDTTAPDHTFLELPDILAVSEGYTTGGTFNRVAVGDSDVAISDSLAWIPDYDGARTGIVRATLSPWRGGVNLIHTGASDVRILGSEVNVWDVEGELVEVFKNEGATQYPIYEVQAIEWEATPLGALIFDQDSRQLAVSADPFNGLIRLGYRTRSLDYRVDLASGRPTQFLLESAPL